MHETRTKKAVADMLYYLLTYVWSANSARKEEKARKVEESLIELSEDEDVEWASEVCVCVCLCVYVCVYMYKYI